LFFFFFLFKDRKLDGKSYSLITDYFGDTNPGSLVVWILYMVHLVSILPVFFEISRDRLLKLIYKEKPIPKKLRIIINISFVVACVVMKNIPGLDPDVITNFNGSICCFFFVYLIPIFLHMMSVYKDHKVMVYLREKLCRFDS
jgi:solute carrier family 38 (sodium-coupled neutral amino acid transporter), member 9